MYDKFYLSGYIDKPKSRRKQIFRIMRISLILTFFCTISMFAENAYSQRARVTIKQRNVNLETVLNEIENQTDYLFLYNSKKVDVSRNVSVNVRNMPVNQVLGELFSSTQVSFLMEGTHIVLLAGDETVSTVEAVRQQITITGTVVDAGGETLPGVNVMVKGTAQGTITDTNGAYTLAVTSENATLVFSFVGHLTQEVVVGNQRIIDVALSSDASEIEELVVVGYGTQRRVNLSGSVASINLENLNETRPVTNLTQALQGQMAGLMVQQNSGLPGAEDMNILVRGRGTLNNSAPLVIVDGIVGSMSDVAPSDVATISVLKDAASSAIYGSRAANGVILITTKQGAKDRTVITYTGHVGFQQPTFFIDIVDDTVLWMETLNKARDNAGQPPHFDPDGIISEWREGVGTDEIYANTNWYKEVFKPAFIQEHNIQASGGTSSTNFMFSIGYQGDEGSMPKTDFQRYNLRLNLNAQIKPFIRAGINVSGFHSISQNSDSDRIETFLGYLSNSTPATLPKTSDGRFGGDWTPGGNASNANNLLANIEALDRNRWITHIQAKPFIQVNFTPNITWHSSAGIMFRNSFMRQSESPVSVINPKTGDHMRFAGSTRSRLDEDHRRDKRFVLDTYVNWALPIMDVHNLNFIAGFNQEYEEEQSHLATGFDLVSVETDVMDAAADGSKPTGRFANRSLRSFFGRVNYDYQGKYLFEANLRIDGSSKFAEGHKWGYFPSFSAAWRISEENFMNDVTWLSNLKIRGSWGQLGNNRSGDYATQQIYVASNAILNDGIVPGMASSGISNPRLTWEATTMTNVGLDISVLRNRLSLVADVFYKKTDGILLQLPIPQVVLGGLTSPYQNAAEVSNRGFEITLGWNDRTLSNQLNYGANINYTFVRNKVDKYRGDVETYSGQRILREGLKIYPYYVREVEGIATQETIDRMLEEGYTFFPSTPRPGDFIYKDQQGPDETGYKIINDDDRVAKGSSTPEHVFGFTLYASWNGIDFSTLFQGVSGFNRYLRSTWYTNEIRNYSQINTKFLNAWDANTNPNSKLPAITTDDGGRTSANNDFWLQDASYLRLKNIQIGYTFPINITQRFFVDRLRFYVSAENLLTFTRYEGLDPEQGGGNVYPNLKRYVCGISVTF